MLLPFARTYSPLTVVSWILPALNKLAAVVESLVTATLIW
ncbi:hypothetical protein N624_0385 [Levilactobacillus brevis]|nr:hypothetical protein N624_0385 [Levilactobacillus brevis]